MNAFAKIDRVAIVGAGDRMLHLDGVQTPALSGDMIDVIDPSTGERIGAQAAGADADVDRAVAIARRTFETGVWRDLPAAERQAILWRASDLLSAESERLAALESLNNGMLYPAAIAMTHTAVETLRYYAGWATKVHGIATDLAGPLGEFHAYTRREPIGVAAMIVPWNVPIPLTMVKLAPALASGCSCVIKPAEETPFTALRLAEIFEQAGVPPGVVNVVTGYGHVAGAALAAHKDVDKIAFTGSTEVGRLIVQAAARSNLKKVTLELGGKSPVIVFDDADLAKALPGIAMGVFFHSGQICIAGSRLYVQRNMVEPVIEGLAAIAGAMTVGAAFDPKTQIGPIISERQAQRIERMVTDGVAQGAELIAGGARLDGPGFYMKPTILAHAAQSSEIVTDEVFGPVLTINAFDDMDHAIALANDTQYGLASAVWTRDIAKAHRMAKAMRAGFAWINCQFVMDPAMPGGGFRQSGWGREFGAEGLDAYLQTKSVFTQL